MRRQFREDMHYQYEPEWSRVGKYVFDFSMSFIKASDTSKMPFVCIFLIEYKPSKVTHCYEQAFLKRCRALNEKTPDVAFSFLLYEGSFWDPATSRYRWVEEKEDAIVLCDNQKVWLNQLDAEYVRSIRFDLKGGA
jgi:hypothetical protein